MFGASSYASESTQLSLHPGDLELGESSGRHAALDFEVDILAALAAGLRQGAASVGFTEVDGSTSAPDFAGQIYHRYSGNGGGATVLARVLGSPSGYAGIAQVGVEVGYRKGDQASATAARTIATSVEDSLRNLNTLGSLSRKSAITQPMKTQAKSSLG